MGETFRAEDDSVDFNVVDPYDEQELLKYFPNTKSHLNDTLDQLEKVAFNDDDDTESNFAFEIKNSKKYCDVLEVPGELKILREPELWASVSYCFHRHNPVDPITQYLLNDEFEIVDGNICLQQSSSDT